MIKLWPGELIQCVFISILRCVREQIPQQCMKTVIVPICKNQNVDTSVAW